MFASSGIPLQFIDNSDFRMFVRCLDPEFHLPGKTSLRSHLLVEFRQQLTTAMMVKMRLIESGFALTVGSWTSMANRQFLAITAHGITNDWSLESFVLGLIPVTRSETGEFIAKEFNNTLATWGIKEDKVLAVTTDGGSNMRNFVQKQARFPWVYCTAHALNLVIRKGVVSFPPPQKKTLSCLSQHHYIALGELGSREEQEHEKEKWQGEKGEEKPQRNKEQSEQEKRTTKHLAEVKRLINKVAAIVHLFRKSPLAARDLREHQSPPYTKLCPANSTRWGLTLDMLSRIYQNRRAVTLCLQTIHETQGRDKPPQLYRGGMAPGWHAH